jgi:hypothetical protein
MSACSGSGTGALRRGSWFWWPEGVSFFEANDGHSAVLKWVDEWALKELISDDLSHALADFAAPLVASRARREDVLGWRVYRVPPYLAAELSALPLPAYALEV